MGVEAGPEPTDAKTFVLSAARERAGSWGVGPTYTWLLPSPVSTSGNTRWDPASQVLGKTERGNAGYAVPKREPSSFIPLPYVTQRHSVSRRCWKNGTDTLAPRRVARDLQSAKNTIFAKCNKAKRHKTRSACAWHTVKAQLVTDYPPLLTGEETATWQGRGDLSRVARQFIKSHEAKMYKIGASLVAQW